MDQDIQELNLAYLLLAQKLIRHDAALAQFRLGLSGEVTGILANLSLSQTIQLAKASEPLCSLRIHAPETLSALLAPHRVPELPALHTTILLAAQPVEEIG